MWRTAYSSARTPATVEVVLLRPDLEREVAPAPRGVVLLEVDQAVLLVVPVPRMVADQMGQAVVLPILITFLEQGAPKRRVPTALRTARLRRP